MDRFERYVNGGQSALLPLNTAEDILSGEADYGAIADCGGYSDAP